MKEKNMGKLWIGATVFIIVAANVVLDWIIGWGSWSIVSIPILGILIAIFSLWLWAIRTRWRERREGLTTDDERTKLIRGRAGYHAFLFGSWFMLVLLWYDWFERHGTIGGPELNTAWALILSILANSGLFLLLCLYYGRKDVGSL